MTPFHILVLYLSVFLAGLFWENILLLINLNHARKKMGNAPDFVLRLYSPPEFSKSVEYTTAKGVLSLIQSVLNAVFVLFLVLSGVFGVLDAWLSSLAVPDPLVPVLFVLSVFIIFHFFELPFDVYRHFRIEKDYGFTKMGPGLWILDQFKSLLLSLFLNTAVLFILFWFIANTGGFWWIYGYTAFMLIQLFLFLIYPVLIAPIFNRFKPLEEGELKDKIERLAMSLSFNIKGIFVMDASRRSSHSNAYFTGIGRSKRIVLFDTLIEQLDTEEIVSVLAHEIGHNKKKHIIKSMVFSSLIVLAVFLIVNFLMDYTPLYLAFGIDNPSAHALLVIMMFCLSPVMFFLTPLFSFLSRIFEYEADRFAVKAVGASRHLISSLEKLATKNLSNLVPHPWYSAFHYSHPALSERIDRLLSLENDA